jgi:diguanylate cyclase (GGDEF)-like protein/PAS domain S-box-containing protein
LPAVLTARDALHPLLRPVADEARPAGDGHEDVVFAVYGRDDDRGTEGFRGLVTRRDIAEHPGRIFADILPLSPLPGIAPDTPLAEVRALMDRHRAEALAVVDASGELRGAVTRASLLTALLRHEQTLRERLGESQSAALALFTLNAQHTGGEEFLQRGIEILARLVDARYGAIGILGEDRQLAQFIHTGIDPATAQRIGHPPRGTGLLGVVVDENRVLRLEDMSKHPASAGPPHHPPMKSLLAVPVSHQGRVYGRVYLSEKRDGTPFTDEDEHLAVAYASELGVVVAHARAARERGQVAGELHKLAAAIEQTDDALLITDRNGVIEYVNSAFERHSGYGRAEAVGRKPGDLIKSGLHDSGFYRQLWETLGRGETHRGVFINRRKDGVLYHEAKTISPVKDEAGRITHFVSAGRDISARLAAEGLALRLGRILDSSSNEIYVFDAQTLRFTQVNEGARRNLGYDMEELRQMTPLDLKPDFDRARFDALIAPLRDGTQEVLVFETAHRRKDGSRYPVEVRLQLSRNEHPPVFMAIILDITERKHAEERLNYLAYHDSLTGLPNRLRLLEQLAQAMTEADRHERLVAVMFLDLDRFKNINDSLGHEAGDQLLTEVARRLGAAVRHGDTVARSGGDEFNLVLASIAHVDDVARVAQKIMEQFRAPFRIARQELFVTPSIGITLYPFDDRDPEALIRNADTALYHAKESGRNTFQFFTAELNQRVERQMTLEMGLRQALERDEFLLHYQPQLDLQSGGITGVEALIRWQRGAEMVSPLEFIPLTEETGLIVPIGAWVLRTACAQAMAWRAAGLPAVKMSVNLSARQFREQGLVATIRRILDDTGLPADGLVLEITESALMHNPESVRATLAELDAMGIDLSVDDFGTGYSSLSYLKRFPIDSLKIDKSFIRDITTDTDDAAIAQAVIGLAHSLDIQVVAEGVETLPQLMFLRSRHCDAMQGYYFSKPLPARDMTQLLYENRRLTLPADDAPDPQRTLLIVDDEANVRQALIRALRRDGYRILAADGPGAALELLAQMPVGVVLSDQQMPGMTGVEFLERVKELHPRTVRIVLSGYTELNAVTDAINRGSVYKFLTKPWDDEELRLVLRRAFRHYDADGQTARVAGGKVGT